VVEGTYQKKIGTKLRRGLGLSGCFVVNFCPIPDFAEIFEAKDVDVVVTTPGETVIKAGKEKVEGESVDGHVEQEGRERTKGMGEAA